MVLFSVVFVCRHVFVSVINLEPFEISSRNFDGSKQGSKAQTNSKMAAYDALADARMARGPWHQRPLFRAGGGLMSMCIKSYLM